MHLRGRRNAGLAAVSGERCGRGCEAGGETYNGPLRAGWRIIRAERDKGSAGMEQGSPVVGIVIGSKSDWPVMRHCAETLEGLGIPCESKVLSAHRTPDKLAGYVKGAKGRGLKVLIAGAGMAAALPGAVAALTPLPVFGVPMEGPTLKGLDALLSMVQMPGGVPVGTLAIGKAGAINSALLAASVLALSDGDIAKALDDYRARQTAAVDEDPESS